MISLIHTFSILPILIGIVGKMQPILADFGQEWGYTLDWLPVDCRAHEVNEHLHTFTSMYILESAVNPTCVVRILLLGTAIPTPNAWIQIKWKGCFRNANICKNRDKQIMPLAQCGDSWWDKLKPKQNKTNIPNMKVTETWGDKRVPREHLSKQWANIQSLLHGKVGSQN